MEGLLVELVPVVVFVTPELIEGVDILFEVVPLVNSLDGSDLLALFVLKNRYPPIELEIIKTV